MRAELRGIDWHDHPGPEALAALEVAEPWDHFGWFTLSIGPEGDKGADYFEVCIATPPAVVRAMPWKRFRGLVVDSFDPDTITRAVEEFVAAATGLTWDEVVAKLRTAMHWEYEGMGGA